MTSELFDQQHLVGVLSAQPIRTVNEHDLDVAGGRQLVLAGIRGELAQDLARPHGPGGHGGRHAQVRRLAVPEGPLPRCPRASDHAAAPAGERYFADGLRELPDSRRLAILAVCAVEWELFLADAVVETHDRIVGRTYREAARTCEGQLGDETAAVREALRAFAELVTALIQGQTRAGVRPAGTGRLQATGSRREDGQDAEGVALLPAKTLKGSRYCLLKHPKRLKPGEKRRLAAVRLANRALDRAYELKEYLATILEQATPDDARELLDQWLDWASRSRLAPFVKLAWTIRKHAVGILAYLDTRMTNGPVEGINNKLR